MELRDDWKKRKKSPSIAKGNEMTIDFNATWVTGTRYVSDSGTRDYPSWDLVETMLRHVISQGGTLSLMIIPQPERGPQSLEVRSEQGLCLLHLGEINDDDYEDRTFYKPDQNASEISILGCPYDSAMVCEDATVVFQVFEEFFRTGNVSRDILN